MGIFKSTKTRNIFIYSICAIGVTASIATICVVLWPKDSTSTNVTTTNNSGNSNSTHNSMYNLLHQNDNDTKSDSTPSYATPYTYTPSDTSPATPQYNVPSYTPTTTPTKTCADYHAEYYSEYQTQLHDTNTHYTNAINNAASSCKSYGGCPQKTSLEQQWKATVIQLQNSYKTSMASAGCDPSEYVDF